MTRPTHCPDCGTSVTAHTGTYCHECGIPLVEEQKFVDIYGALNPRTDCGDNDKAPVTDPAWKGWG